MRHAATRILFAYWDSLRGERTAPERGEIEPGAIRHILANTFILEVDVIGSAAFRLAGTRLCALAGGELKGRAFASLWREEAASEVAHLLDTVLDDAAGVIGGVSGATARGATVNLELLLLPLRHRGKTHARMLGALSPLFVPTWLGLDPVVSLTTLSLRMIWPSGRDPDAAERARLDRRRHLVVHQGGRV